MKARSVFVSSEAVCKNNVTEFRKNNKLMERILTYMSAYVTEVRTSKEGLMYVISAIIKAVKISF